MKKILGPLVVAGTVVLAGQAPAEELWDPYLRGVNEGLAAGALPPPGVYGVLNNYWVSYSIYGSNGKKVSGQSAKIPFSANIGTGTKDQVHPFFLHQANELRDVVIIGPEIEFTGF